MAFTVKNKVLVISEHQSTINFNMPLRSIIYYGRTMEQLIEPKKIYREKRIPIPTPEFYVFYNGDTPFPTESLMKLSDAYLEKSDNPDFTDGCKSARRICVNYLVNGFQRDNGRINVILCGEDLGY